MSLTDEIGDNCMLNELNQIIRIHADFFYIWNPGLQGEYEKELLGVWYGEVGRKGEEI